MLLDLSHHNTDTGPIAWSRLPASVQGAYIKLTEGASYVDPASTPLRNGARVHGIPVGAYHFADMGNPVTEANHFADVYLTGGTPWQLRPVLDIESANATASWLAAFRAQFRKRVGTQPFRVYSSYSLLVGALNPAGWIDDATDIWAARYRATLGWDHPALVLWQNTSTANLAGVVGSVDEDQYQHGWTPATDQGDDMATDFTSSDGAGKTYGWDVAHLRELGDSATTGFVALGAKLDAQAAQIAALGKQLTTGMSSEEISILAAVSGVDADVKNGFTQLAATLSALPPGTAPTDAQVAALGTAVAGLVIAQLGPQIGPDVLASIAAQLAK